MFQAPGSLQWHVALSLPRHRNDGIFAVHFKHSSEHLPEEVQKNVQDILGNRRAKKTSGVIISGGTSSMGTRRNLGKGGCIPPCLLVLHDDTTVESGGCARRAKRAA